MRKAEIRRLEVEEYRAAYDVARVSQHNPPVSTSEWDLARHVYEPGLAVGAIVDGAVVGTVNLLPSQLTVPGGASLPMAASTGSGVHTDYTRQGLFNRLKQAQFDTAVEHGYLLIGNTPAQATLYGRFGHGVSTHSRALRIRKHEARLRSEVPAEGTVRLIDPESSLELLPKLYEQLGPYRPGVIARSAHWWKVYWERAVRAGQHFRIAVHSGAAGDDGFAVYAAKDNGSPGPNVTLLVTDFHAAGPAATAGLWRHLLSIDLVDEVCVRTRPTDELVEAMLVDWRGCRTHSIDDELWLRLLDVPAVLAARTYCDAKPVVLEVVDAFRPANSGRFRISPEGAVPTSETAQLTVDVDVLAMAYLGTTKFSTLAGIGRVQVAEPAALAHADRLFATDVASFCGTPV
ncbi:GNAT family N-acetyltransferase [Saccharopolyspora shandongensis]|uniref:GNAT family N-acetyltransferase n=1 Tax=Saccharopolyspora shandongensis TaxID=418495 RepID=UPI0033D45E42